MTIEKMKRTILFDVNFQIHMINISESVDEFKRLFERAKGMLDTAHRLEIITVDEWSELGNKIFDETWDKAQEMGVYKG